MTRVGFITGPCKCTHGKRDSLGRVIPHDHCPGGAGAILAFRPGKTARDARKTAAWSRRA